jgi:hypothetical protein
MGSLERFPFGYSLQLSPNSKEKLLSRKAPNGTARERISHTKGSEILHREDLIP